MDGFDAALARYRAFLASEPIAPLLRRSLALLVPDNIRIDTVTPDDSFFMQHPNAVLSKEQILDALWDCDGDYIDSSALTVYIRRLRMKIEDDPGKPQMLLTVRGMGYKWNG